MSESKTMHPHNRRRNVTLTPQVVGLARLALDTQYEVLTDLERVAASLRVRYPEDTLTKLAKRAGTTKDAFWSRLRTAIRIATDETCRDCGRSIPLRWNRCPRCNGAKQVTQ